jgi:hypothetical protein
LTSRFGSGPGDLGTLELARVVVDEVDRVFVDAGHELHGEHRRQPASVYRSAAASKSGDP